MLAEDWEPSVEGSGWQAAAPWAWVWVELPVHQLPLLSAVACGVGVAVGRLGVLSGTV